MTDFNLFCGKILSSHGLLGYMKCQLYHSSLLTNMEIYANNNLYIIEDIKSMNKQCVIMKFKNINSINDTYYLKSAKIFIQRVKLQPEEMYYQDLIGYKVFDEANNYQAEVVDVLIHSNQVYLYFSSKLYVPIDSEFISEINDDKIICNSVIF